MLELVAGFRILKWLLVLCTEYWTFELSAGIAVKFAVGTGGRVLKLMAGTRGRHFDVGSSIKG